MGIIIHEQAFDDDYSRDIIQRLRGLSPELDEYVVTEGYLRETQEENLSPLWLRNRLLIKTIEQLTDRGILFNMNPDDMCDAPIVIDAVITLRSKFDSDKLFDYLKDHQTAREALFDLIEDDCIEDICRSCARTTPLDEGWDSLVRFMDQRPGIIFSNAKFTELIVSTLEHCDRLGDNALIHDDDMTRLNEYMSYLSTRKSKIAKLAGGIYATSMNSEKPIEGAHEIVLEAMKDFETVLSSPGTIRKFLDSEFLPKSFTEKIRELKEKTWKHCFEYYVQPENAMKVPDELRMAILVATLFVDAPDPTHARSYVIEQSELLIDQFGDRYNTIRDMIDRDLGNIVVMEVMNNEAQ